MNFSASNPGRSEVDVLVVGAGAAGMTAALVGATGHQPRTGAGVRLSGGDGDQGSAAAPPGLMVRSVAAPLRFPLHAQGRALRRVSNHESRHGTGRLILRDGRTRSRKC
jgi:hypothetical protein